MNKIAHYLQEHLVGEVVYSDDARQHFSNDASVFTVTPSVVAYPRNESDIRKIARFTWQLAERGRVIPITARGMGSDLSGAALGKGIMVVFPAYMNRILELDTKSGEVTVEAGIIYGRLQQALHTHGRYLPPYPASIDYSTIGGAVANNAGGKQSVKYGSMRDYTKSLKVVLANGEVIETGRLSKRELSKKMGLSSFEGEIYRNLDKLIEENKELINKLKLAVTKNSSGYNIFDVKQKNTLDLTPLIVGSQGTLGIVSEVTLGTEVHNPNTTLIAGFFTDQDALQRVITELLKMPDLPSAVEFINGGQLAFIAKNYPNQLKGLVGNPLPKGILFIELNNSNDRVQKKIAKKVIKIITKYSADYQLETKPEKREKLWSLHHTLAATLTHNQGDKKALPIATDGVVPVSRQLEFIKGMSKICTKYELNSSIWGHAGNANLSMQPFLDLSQVGDRQKVFKIVDEYYSLVISLGGSISGEQGDGRLRAPYLKQMYGEEIYDLFCKVKAIFDPYGTLNPGVKINVSLDDIKPLVSEEYSLGHLYNYLPRA